MSFAFGLKLSLLIFLFSPALFADEALEAKHVPENEPIVLGLVLEFPIYSFYLGSPDINGEAYVPNYIPRLGPQISWKGYGARMTFTLDQPTREKQRRGKSEQRNFLFNFYWKKYAVNFYYQYFKGFYVASPFTEISENRPSRYTQLPQAEATHFGINLYLKSDAGKYGLDAAFDQNVFQLTEGGGWIYVPYYRQWTIDLGNQIIPGTAGDSLQEIPDISGGTFDTLGTTYGYAHTWVYENYYLSALGSVGPGIQHQKYEDSGNEFSKFTLAGKLNVKGSIGLKRKEAAVGAQAVLDTLYSRIAGTEIYSTMASLEFYYNRSL